MLKKIIIKNKNLESIFYLNIQILYNLYFKISKIC